MSYRVPHFCVRSSGYSSRTVAEPTILIKPYNAYLKLGLPSKKTALLSSHFAASHWAKWFSGLRLPAPITSCYFQHFLPQFSSWGSAIPAGLYCFSYWRHHKFSVWLWILHSSPWIPTLACDTVSVSTNLLTLSLPCPKRSAAKCPHITLSSSNMEETCRLGRLIPILEKLGLESDLKVHLVPLPAVGRASTHQIRLPIGPIQPGHECLQGWGFSLHQAQFHSVSIPASKDTSLVASSPYLLTAYNPPSSSLGRSW